MFLSNAIRRQNSENNRNKTSEFYRRSTYRRTRRVSLLGPLERGLYLLFVRSRKRNIAATFAKPRADNLRALGPNGSGRGPIKPYRAEASKVTQTAIMAHKGNHNTVVCPRKPYSVESLDIAATNRNVGVAISKTSTTAILSDRLVPLVGYVGASETLLGKYFRTTTF